MAPVESRPISASTIIISTNCLGAQAGTYGEMFTS